MKILEKIVDRNGKEFDLWFSVWQHIQDSHPEIDSTIILKEVLQNPDFIVCSNWETASYLYYKKEEKYYKVIVVDIVKECIKTAYTADKVKIGEIKWKKEI